MFRWKIQKLKVKFNFSGVFYKCCILSIYQVNARFSQKSL